jgi:CheY-like chemotaxis protein
MPNKLPFRILVIDDDLLSRELLVLLLTREGHAIDAAESGDAAIETLRGKQAPDIVLADLQMPGICGSQLARKLRDIGGEALRLIAISASPASIAELDGYDAFLLKPFSIQALATILSGKRTVISNEPIRQNVTVLDETIYNKLANAMRPELVAQLYALCLTDAKKRVAAMRDAAARADDEAYRREAHAIKGGTGMVGVVELQTLASTMEDQGIPANYVATLDEFLMACNRVERMLIAHDIAPDHSVTAEATRRNHA